MAKVGYSLDSLFSMGYLNISVTSFVLLEWAENDGESCLWGVLVYYHSEWKSVVECFPGRIEMKYTKCTAGVCVITPELQGYDFYLDN